MKLTLFSVLTLLSAASLATPLPEPEPIPAPTPNQGTARPDPDRFLVTLHPGAEAPKLLGTAQRFAVGKARVFIGKFNDKDVAALKQSTAVLAVEPDGVVTANAIVTQTPAEPGLGAISRVPAGSFSSYIYDNAVNCANKYAYVIDTGIRTTHTEFQGRASCGWNFVSNNANCQDDNGHGTHCAGTIGGRIYGVFKTARLVGVKVLDSSGSGTWSNVIAGIAWAVQDCTTKGRLGHCVISMSLGGGTNTAVNAMVDASVYAGVPNFVAAGNNNYDASYFSPASASQAFAVGAAISQNDCRASFSNYGRAVKIYGPGQNVRAAYYTSDSATAVLSGTSMATPHVAGLALYFMCQSGYTTPASVYARILQCGNARPSAAACPAPYDYKSTDPNEIAYNCVV